MVLPIKAPQMQRTRAWWIIQAQGAKSDVTETETKLAIAEAMLSDDLEGELGRSERAQELMECISQGGER